MKTKWLCPLVMFCMLVSARPGNSADETPRAAAAMEILDGWHKDQPAPQKRTLHLVCWTPSDRPFPAEYQARLTRIMRHIQDFYLREMERLGLGPRTFNLDEDNNGRLVLHKVSGLHATEYYGKSSGNEIRKECLVTLQAAGIDASRETILVLCNLANWDSTTLRFTHKSPYYAGGSFRSGTAWQLDSPELDSENLKLAKPIITDGQYGRISLGKHNSIFIGGIAHELGHALGLPHCKARPDEAIRGTALMGSGNRTYGDELRGDSRGSFLTLAHGLRLASHPQFSGSVKGLNQRSVVSMDNTSITTDGRSIRVEGVVKGMPAVYAVVAYFDPEGGGDYDATTATAVPTADGRFSLSCDALPRNKRGELRLFPLHANGSAAGQMSTTRYRYAYSVNADGTPDLSFIQTKQQLESVISALNSGQRQQAIESANEVSTVLAGKIAKRLIQRHNPIESPFEYDGKSDFIALADLLTVDESVGWGRPAYNRVPDQSRVLESGGQFFETGIYAHAPARHVYRLGRKWKLISGTVGLAAGHPGSVQFEIKGDGKSLWKSRTVKEGSVSEFSIPLDDIDQLELLTHTTADGAGADWGLWLEPTLRR